MAIEDPGITDSPSASGERMKVSFEDKRVAANALETEVNPGAQQAGKLAKGKTRSAQSEFSAWEFSRSLQRSLNSWSSKCKELTTHISSDTRGLNSSLLLFSATEEDTARGFRPSRFTDPRESRISGL